MTFDLIVDKLNKIYAIAGINDLLDVHGIEIHLGGDVLYIQCKSGIYDVKLGRLKNSDAEVIISSELMANFINRKANPSEAFENNEFSISGDEEVAIKLLTVIVSDCFDVKKLKSMTITELRTFADGRGISIPKEISKKDEIVETISDAIRIGRRNLLNEMSVPDLKQYAKKKNIQISSSAKKADIIESILENNTQVVVKKASINIYKDIDKEYKKNKDKLLGENYKVSYEKKSSGYVESKRKEILIPKNVGIINKELQLNELKRYIDHVIHMESEVYYLGERLTDIYLQQKINEIKIELSEGLLEKKEKKNNSDLGDVQKEIRSLEAKIRDVDNRPIKTDFSFSWNLEPPVKPMEPQKFTKEEPIAPKLYKPGLFFKKKTLEKNEKLLEEYEEEKRKYEEEKAEYDRCYSSYYAEVLRYNQQKAEYDWKYEEAYARAQQVVVNEKKSDLVEELDQKKKRKLELDKIREGIKEFSKNNLLNSVSEVLVYEEKRLKEEMETVLKALAEMYSYNIIYEKYRNYVALTTIYEYLDSGRVDTLEGVNGAYNLYEAETRSNTIISKLDNILDSLEEIKANQYLLYSKMNEIEKDVSESNKLLDSVLDELIVSNWNSGKTSEFLRELNFKTDSISKKASKIENNTGIAAYYAKESAHYAKVNAELTNALGYMIAFK